MAIGPVPAWVKYAVAIAVAASWVPLGLIARAKYARSDKPRVHIIQDMDNQVKFRPQELNPTFADRRAMRPVVAGTVARGELREDDHLYRGKVQGEWATSYPMPITMERLERGRREFEIYCLPCHGAGGAGDGPVHQRAVLREQATWIQPTSLVSDAVRDRPVGHVFNSISHGIRTMPGYATQISPQDRWAIIMYVRALQLSRRATLDDVPADKRDSIRPLQ